jgi:hypothetical protein
MKDPKRNVSGFADVCDCSVPRAFRVAPFHSFHDASQLADHVRIPIGRRQRRRPKLADSVQHLVQHLGQISIPRALREDPVKTALDV